LNMKLVGVEYTFDRSKIIFFFTSEERVDFRELVKDLASIFKTRIELRQIGVRDEAKLIGGFGPCGRSFCCASFLEEFEPVSIRMAKGQNLSLNPTKISGVCGRLMCCLRFEMNTYDEAREDQFSTGEFVVTPDGEGIVEKVNSRKKIVLVKLREAGCVREFPLEEVDRV
jgi:cell fate regulator YaaT (PSP1 superfamily)